MKNLENSPSFVKASRLPVVGTALIGLVAAIPSADAQVVSTTVTSGGTISAGSDLYFDLGETGGSGSWSNSSISGADFALNFGAVFPPPSVPTKPQIVPTGSNGVVDSSGFVAQLSLNTSINSSLSWTTGTKYFSTDWPSNAGWSSGTRSYIGLRVDAGGGSYKYGWADVEYTSGRQLTLYSFAVQTTPDAPILAGSVVPEPKQTGIMMALLAGSAALYHRRRKLARSQETAAL